MFNIMYFIPVRLMKMTKGYTPQKINNHVTSIHVKQQKITR